MEQSTVAEGFDGPLHCVGTQTEPRTVEVLQNTVVQYVDQEMDTSDEAPVNAGIGQDPKMVQSDQVSESYEHGRHATRDIVEVTKIVLAAAEHGAVSSNEQILP